MFSNVKYKWAVMLVDSKKYVTRIHNANKMSYWYDDSPAVLMSRRRARELALALTSNGYNAVTVEIPVDWGIELYNPPKNTDEVKNNG